LPVFIQSAARTPYGAFGGALRLLGPEWLAAEAVLEALRQAGCEPSQVKALILGQSLRYGRGPNPARRTALAAGLGSQAAAWSVDQGPATGLRAVASGVQAILAGSHDRVAVVGADSSSSAPYLLPEGRWGHRLGQSTALDPLILEAPERQEAARRSLEIHQRGMDIPDSDLMDWVTQSQHKAQAATAEGGFLPECFPLEYPTRKGSGTLALDEVLACPPALEPGWPLPPLADGAAALLLSAHPPEGPGFRVLGFQEAWADRPTEALASVTQSLLDRADLRPQDLDQVEVDESLILAPLALLRDFHGLRPHCLNPRGGAFATGQAFGAEGVRLLVSLCHGLDCIEGRFGLAALATSDGLGLAFLLERNLI